MAPLPEDQDAKLVKERETYDAALKLKEEGNTLFKKGDLKGALKNYSRMLIHLGMKPHFPIKSLGLAEGAMDMSNPVVSKNDARIKELQNDADLLRKTCFNNMSAVYAKMGAWEKSLEKARMVLELDDKNQKAMFRIGVAYRNLKEYDKAEESLLKTQKLKDSASIRNELKKVKRALALQQAKNDKRWEKAFKKHAATKRCKTIQTGDINESVELKQDIVDPEKHKKNEVDEEKRVENKSQVTQSSGEASPDSPDVRPTITHVKHVEE